MKKVHMLIPAFLMGAIYIGIKSQNVNAEKSLCKVDSLRTYTVKYVQIFPSAYAYQALSQVSKAGVIEGKVVFAGQKVPENKRKLITKDQEVCGSGYKIDKVYEFGQGNTVKNAVVYLENVKSGKPAQPKNIELKQEKCEFHPRIMAVLKGSTLVIENKDPVTHEANGIFNFATIFQLSQPKQNQKDTVVLKDAGLVDVSCNIHGWMKAWIMVLDNPYYAISDNNGSFRIEDIPPGKYKLKVWHEGFGTKELDVEVKEGSITRLEIAYQK